MQPDRQRLAEDLPLTSNHWGTYGVETADGKLTAVRPFSEDPNPSAIGQGIVDSLDGPTRITEPMIRRDWLENGPGSSTTRGIDPFVAVSWDEAETLVSSELARVSERFGNPAIFGGSYGWASAGRFHHAQSQLHRFLNCIGGFTRSVNTYSFAAAEVLVPHVLGGFREFTYPGTSWRSIIEHSDLVVAFGGIPIKNGQIAQGGCGRHRQPEAVIEAAEAGVQFINISPMRGDMMNEAKATWLAPLPCTDTAIMLGIAHTLLVEGLHDIAFLKRNCVGFDRFAQYLRGEVDGTEKSAEWAAKISRLPAITIADLARRMANCRTMISVSWSLTRQDHGEQPFWAAIAIAAMLGQIGQPGGGIGFGYSAVNSVGNDYVPMRFAALPQGKNPVSDFIPVARISDMLLNPGASFTYNGQVHTYPDIKLVYWAGGNPFHHHQDLNRLRLAWQRPETIIAHEWCWNGLARHSDIVLPCTTPLEREDIALTPRDRYIVKMDKAVDPIGSARDDYAILLGIAERLNVAETFSEGRSADEWIRHIYEISRQNAAQHDVVLPTFETLNRQRWFEIDMPVEPNVLLKAFREDPNNHPLNTPSGKIELWSETIDRFGYADCPGQPRWMEPVEWLGNAGKFPLHLISNQPADKLHSQLDHGSVSRAKKINGREPIIINSQDADARGIRDGDVVKAYNDRGACYCGAILSDDIRTGVVCISTGAWLDPETNDPITTCKHGNPNMLTMDKGTSSLAQGPIAHSCLVEVERIENPPDVTAFNPPIIVEKLSEMRDE